MKKLDLTRLLRGHEGEEFWSPVFGDMTFLEIGGNGPCLKFKACINLTPSGRLDYPYDSLGECTVWPSKECRTWENWGKTCWSCLYSEDGGFCKKCPGEWITKSTPACEEYKSSSSQILENIKERLKEGEDNLMEDIKRLLEEG